MAKTRSPGLKLCGMAAAGGAAAEAQAAGSTGQRGGNGPACRMSRPRPRRQIPLVRRHVAPLSRPMGARRGHAEITGLGRAASGAEAGVAGGAWPEGRGSCVGRGWGEDRDVGRGTRL